MRQAWNKMTPLQRYSLMGRLGIGKDLLTRGISLKRASFCTDFLSLPIPVRTVLGGAFENGRFSKTAQKRELKAIGAIMKEMDKVEEDYSNALY